MNTNKIIKNIEAGVQAGTEKACQDRITETAAKLIRDVDMIRATREVVHYAGYDKDGLADDIEKLINHCAERGDFIRCSRCGEVMSDADEVEGCCDRQCPLL